MLSGFVISGGSGSPWVRDESAKSCEFLYFLSTRRPPLRSLRFRLVTARVGLLLVFRSMDWCLVLLGGKRFALPSKLIRLIKFSGSGFGCRRFLLWEEEELRCAPNLCPALRMDDGLDVECAPLLRLCAFGSLLNSSSVTSSCRDFSISLSSESPSKKLICWTFFASFLRLC